MTLLPVPLSSRANEPAFDRAVEEIVSTTTTLLSSLVTTAPPKDRDVEAEKAQRNRRFCLDASYRRKTAETSSLMSSKTSTLPP